MPPGARVLDVGAGSSPYRPLFSHCRYIAHDACELPPEQIRGGRYAAMDLISDVHALPCLGESFDVVLCTEVLEHVSQPIVAIKEFARILKGGGRLILTAPLGSGLHQQPKHFYGGYTPFWYEHFLSDSGFIQVVVTPNGGFFEHFGQECQRLATITSQRWKGRLWALPFRWTTTLVFGVALPLLCHAASSWDTGKEFTVGYFVTATKA